MTKLPLSREQMQSKAEEFARVAACCLFGELTPSPDLVAFEESEQWRVFCDANPYQWGVVHKLMYDEVRKLHDAKCMHGADLSCDRVWAVMQFDEGCGGTRSIKTILPTHYLAECEMKRLIEVEKQWAKDHDTLVERYYDIEEHPILRPKEYTFYVQYNQGGGHFREVIAALSKAEAIRQLPKGWKHWELIDADAPLIEGTPNHS